MDTMEKDTRSVGKNRKRRRVNAKGQAVMTVVSVRISNEEKERIDEIMRHCDIKRYSDVLRMAFQMVQVANSDEQKHASTSH